ncbi:MAG TPA: FHA domain-containing protein [Polyangiales bacterium]|nr:FHA domain-containing protein [Polyangiales bacterium]
MIVCPRCSKENQDHYKFCLGCGSELPREAAAPRALSPRTPPSSQLSAAQAPLIAAPEKSLQYARTQQGGPSNPPPRSAAVAAVASAIAAPEASGNGAVPSAAGNAALASAMMPQRAAAEPTTAPSAHNVAVAVPAPAAPVPLSSISPNPCPSCGNPVPIDFKFCGTCGHRMPGAAGLASAAAQPSAAREVAKPSRGSLVVINPDGSEGGSFPLADGTTSIGRTAGALFAADAYLSPSHATFSLNASSSSVKDENSLNGVYIKLKRDVPVKLNDGDVFRIGQELIRFDVVSGPQFVQGVEPMGSPNPGYVGRLSLVIGRESTGNGYPIPPDGMHLGRERGDVIFPEDGYVSGLHCRVHYDGTSCVLTDVGSSNGTFLRVRGTRAVVTGDLLLMGQQLFRIQC